MVFRLNNVSGGGCCCRRRRDQKGVDFCSSPCAIRDRFLGLDFSSILFFPRIDVPLTKANGFRCRDWRGEKRVGEEEDNDGE